MVDVPLLLTGLSNLVHNGLSRQRHAAADLIAATMTGRPDHAARLLGMMSAGNTRLSRGRLFAQDMCVMGKTHSPTPLRIDRLRGIADGTVRSVLGAGPFVAASGLALLTAGYVSMALAPLAAGPNVPVAADPGQASASPAGSQLCRGMNDLVGSTLTRRPRHPGQLGSIHGGWLGIPWWRQAMVSPLPCHVSKCSWCSCRQSRQ
ncbi:M48 family metalloprotease [Nonomuraea sediminis]|uniref:M48 family metalloprotease n=1 Tax=Nonomuraea sediminis TaxID=2835864 RepID=UPI001BDC834A|nr:M48 family metalloprotease [Nonomuraea sediminis]